jgi:hypothetical protein
MSLPQQMRSDVAAHEADQRRRELDGRSKHGTPTAIDDSPRISGIGVKLRAFIRGLFSL